MFDPSKLDISDEFKSVIEELRPYEDKVHCVLNKADALDSESLMRVYGALLWSMGKIFRAAEVTRVYVGSFKDEPLIRPEHELLFQKDKDVLMQRLNDLPKACGMRKVNEMVKRIRLATINVCLLGHLRSKMPYLWGYQRAQDRLIERLPEVFQELRRKYDLSEGDFPNIDDYRAVLKLLDFTRFPHTKREVLLSLRTMLTNDIPAIMSHIHSVEDLEVDSLGNIKVKKTTSNSKLKGAANAKATEEQRLVQEQLSLQRQQQASENALGVFFVSICILVTTIIVSVGLYYVSLDANGNSKIFSPSGNYAELMNELLPICLAILNELSKLVNAILVHPVGKFVQAQYKYAQSVQSQTVDLVNTTIKSLL